VSCRLLKKHHKHEDLPMRTCLGKWKVLDSRLLPLFSRYSSDQ